MSYPLIHSDSCPRRPYTRRMGSYRDNPPAVAAIAVSRETESAQGWLYDTEILWAGAGVSNHAVTLSWVDHDHLSGGRTPPEASPPKGPPEGNPPLIGISSLL